MTTQADRIAAAQGTYSVQPYRYARNCLVVRTTSNAGWKTRAARLIEAIGGRWVHRAGGYVASTSKVAKFERLFREGWDASYITGALEAPAAKPAGGAA